jgi:hypothetical protein
MSTTPAGLMNELVVDVYGVGEQAQALERLQTEAESRSQQLLAVWTAEYGLLNRLYSLWEGPASALSPLTKAEPTQDWLSRERIARALTPRRPLRQDLLAQPVLELRTYAAKPGCCDAFVQALLAALPHRERYSPNAGLWTTRERGTDLVYHLWTYSSLEERMAARQGSQANAEWSAYRASIRPLLHALQASLLVPVAFA